MEQPDPWDVFIMNCCEAIFVNSKEVALEGFAQDTFGKGGGHMFVVFLVWFWWKGDRFKPR